MPDKKVVVIGGGTGTDITLSGLKRYTSRLTALISTFDVSSRGQWQSGSGGSSPDEIRSSLLALGADPLTTQIMTRLFAHQLARSVEQDANTFGNLFLSTLTEITGSADLALAAAARLLNVQGMVLPITLQPCPLVAHLTDGSQATVKTPADLIAATAEVGLRRISVPEGVPALNAALEAIISADIVVLGPTDFHFNLLAPLQLDSVVEALAASNAVKIFVCNILTQPNTTDGWPASRFMRVMLDSMGGPGSLDYVIVNSTSLGVDVLALEAARGYFPVRLDLEESLSLGVNVIVRPVASQYSVQHDPQKLVRTILFLGGWRTLPRTEKAQLFTTDHFNLALGATPIVEALHPSEAAS